MTSSVGHTAHHKVVISVVRSEMCCCFLLVETLDSVVSNRIVEKCDKTVPWVNGRRFTESDFGYDVILSRWRS